MESRRILRSPDLKSLKIFINLNALNPDKKLLSLPPPLINSTSDIITMAKSN